MPSPPSVTETDTSVPSRAADTRIGAVSTECLAALSNRFPSTWTMRRASAMTRSPCGASTVTGWRPPAPAKAVRARSTMPESAAGAGSTDSVPAPMRPASSRSPISPDMRPDCSSTMRRYWRSSSRSASRRSSSAVEAEPRIAASGALSSWLTSSRNSARERSSASNGARSWSVTTSRSTAPSAGPIGVASSSVRTLLPPGTEISTSSARTVSAWPRSASVTSRPSPRRHTSASRSHCRERSSSFSSSGASRRRASRLSESGAPLAASNTATPTGQVSTSASRSARARCSSRCARALASADAACCANSTSIASSASAKPPALPPRKKPPTASPRWRIGVAWNAPHGTGMGEKPSPPAQASRSGRRSGVVSARSCSNSRGPSGHVSMARCCSSSNPEVTKSRGAPASSTVAMAPQAAPVSARALSITSRSTVSRSRLAPMRRMAAVSAASRPPAFGAPESGAVKSSWSTVLSSPVCCFARCLVAGLPDSAFPGPESVTSWT